MKSNPTSGFSLLELMVALAIMAILAGLAISIYRPFMNKTVCSKVEVVVHQTMLKAVKELTETGTVPSGNATTALGIVLPDDVASVVVSGSGTAASPITVNGTAVGNKCPKGTIYVLKESDTKGTWK